MEVRSGRMDLLLILAGLFLVTQPIEAQNCTAEGLEFQDLPLHNFSRLDGDAGSIEPLFNMVNLYLDAVQPNDFPTDMIQNALINPNYINENYQQVVRYQAGYLVSLIIGVLFFIFMPLVGFIFCCCRCCGKCGGEVKERKKSTDCHRNTLAIFLLMTTIIILAGVACAFTANQRVTEAMDPSLAALTGMLADINTYINNTLGATTKLLAQFSVPKAKVFSELDRVSGTLGLTVRDALGPIVSPVLAMVSARIADVSTVKAHLLNISAANVSLGQAQTQLAADLSAERARIVSTLNDPNCMGCNSATATANNLQAIFTYSLPPEVQMAFNKAMSVSTVSLTNSLQQANQTFNDIPGRVTSQTMQIFTDIKRVINDTERNLNSRVVSVQFPDALQNVDTIVNSPQVAEVSAQVKQYDYYRWAVSIVLCCIILLIIACNALGLGLGTAGIATREDVHGSNTCSESGANFLMAGVGFSFIFSSLLILLVFVTFYVGGNARTLGCKPWESGEIYQVVDQLAEENLVYDLSNFFNSSVTYSSLYRHCEEGKSLLLLLPSSQITDLETSLNVDTYSGDIVQNINQLNVDLSNAVLLDSTSRTDLMAFASNIIEAASYTSLIGPDNHQNLANNLLGLASELERLGRNRDNQAIAAALSQHAERLREIETHLSSVRQDMARLNASFQDLATFAPTVQSGISNTIRNIDVAQAEIISTTRNLIKNVSDCLTTSKLDYFRQYLQWVRTMIMDNLFSCQPAVILIDNLRVISCDNITNPWNAFWFCLGWCTLFLIPSIIFAVKTAKHYRAIQNDVGSPALSEMMQFKFPRVENSYPMASGASAPTH